MVGAAFRVWLATSPLGPPDGDEVVGGLIARRLLRGDDVEAFFWGQEYGGIHEQLLVAALLAVRVPARIAMEVVPAALHAVAALLVWRIGLRTVGARAALIAAGLFWATPAAFVWTSTKERGFYGATLVLGLAALLFALRAAAAAASRGWQDAGAFGLAAGSAFYASPQSVFLVLPAGAWLLATTRLRLGGGVRSWAAAVAGALAGAAPWIVVNVSTRFASLRAPSDLPDTEFADRLELFFRFALPTALGLRTAGTLEWAIAGAKLTFAAALVGFVALAILVALRPRLRASLGVVVLIVAVYPIVYASLPTSFYVDEPRYLYQLAPALSLLVGWAVTRIAQPAMRLAWCGALLVLCVVGLDGLNGVEDEPGNRLHDVRPPSLDPVVEALDRSGDSAAFADYWAAYRLAWLTDERVIASPVQLVRYEPYEATVRASANPPYVLVWRSCYDLKLQQALVGLGVGYEREVAGDWAVIRPATKVLPEDLLVEWASARGLTTGAPQRC